MTPELVFGLVGPIGVDMDLVQSRLCHELERVGYTTHPIHLTKLVDQYVPERSGEQTKSYKDKILRSNTLREERSDDSFMSLIAVMEICRLRSQKNAEEVSSNEDLEMRARPKTAYIIRQLKRPEEVNVLKKIYGEKFVQLSISLDEGSRLRYLVNRLSTDNPHLNNKQCEDEARELVDIDSNETSHIHGQRISKIFHLADAFISGKNADTIGKTTERFIAAFFGKNTIGPTKDEFGAYMAKAASLRSIDPARQVGAAILNLEGDLISLGCNEVPKFNGGNYWSDDEDPQRDMELRAETNKIETKRIIHDFLSRLHKAEFLAPDSEVSEVFKSDKFASALSGSLVEGITEYGRMTHAEMSAISDAARLGRSLAGATLHVTTFPCHNCAKHIVAAGIKRLVYIEPYSKSRAGELHRDSISVGEEKKDRVLFQHFEGISPRRYRSIFEKEGRRAKDGSLADWYKGSPSPQIQDLSTSYLYLEAGYIQKSAGDLVESPEPD